jgi:hypothetical protein
MGGGNQRTGGRVPDPIEFEVDGVRNRVTEWEELISAPTTLDKLILIASFYLKLNPVWFKIGKSRPLSNHYTEAQAILCCLTICCGNDLIRFQERWGPRFLHFSFSSQCCPAGQQSGDQCGYDYIRSGALK